MPYGLLPPADTFKRDFGPKPPEFDGMTRVSKLVDNANKIKKKIQKDGERVDQSDKDQYYFHLFHISMHCRRILKVNDKNPGAENANGRVMHKLGTEMLNPDQTRPFRDLQEAVDRELKAYLRVSDNEGEKAFQTRLLREYGREVTQAGKDEDLRLMATLTRLSDDDVRRQFKLSFRDGLAKKKQLGDPPTFVNYDTTAAEDESERPPPEKWGEAATDKRGALYVVDARGRFYVSGPNNVEGDLKHSGFMDGAAVLTGGLIRFDSGLLTYISGSSGHYRPKAMHLVHALERLSTYGVDLKKARVFRVWGRIVNGRMQEKAEWSPAATFLAQRRWPSKVKPAELFVECDVKGDPVP